jgi:hypothetical protein
MPTLAGEAATVLPLVREQRSYSQQYRHKLPSPMKGRGGGRHSGIACKELEMHLKEREFRRLRAQ